MTIAVTILVYAPMLDDFFQSDDFNFLRAARFADFPTYVVESFSVDHYDNHEQFVEVLRDEDIPVPFLSYRPLYFVSLKVMNMAFGDDPVAYHVVSLGVHVVNILLVWAVAARILKGTLAPHAAAAIFALHPAYAPTVSWISDIGTPLAISFALISLLCVMKAQEGPRLSAAWYGGSIAASVVAILFHQETVSWTAILAAYGFLAAFRRGDPLPYRRAWPLAAPFVAIALGSFLVHALITSNTPAHEGAFHLGTHMLTHFKNFAGGGVYPVISANDAAHFVAFIGFLVVLAGTPVLALLSRDDDAVATSLFLVLWWLAAVAPLLTLDGFFGIGILYRKLYAVGPSLGILLAMFGLCALRLVPRPGLGPAMGVAAAALLAAVVGTVSLTSERRNDVTRLADSWEAYVNEMRENVPSVPEGGTLYVVGAPGLITSFGDLYVVATAQAYYGRVNAYAVSEKRLQDVNLRSIDRVFRYPLD